MNLKSLNAWNTTILETKLILQKPSVCYNTTLSEHTITLDDGLGFTIQVYDCYIPEDHTIYKMYRRSMRNISVSDLIQIVGSYNICPGINYIKDDASIYFHVFPLNNDDTNDNEDEPLIPYKSKQFVRSKKCTVLSQEKCEPCMNSEKYFFKINNKNKIRLATPAKLKVPLSKTDRKRVEAALIEKGWNVSKQSKNWEG